MICFEVLEHLKKGSNVPALYELLGYGSIAAITVPNKWLILRNSWIISSSLIYSLEQSAIILGCLLPFMKNWLVFEYIPKRES